MKTWKKLQITMALVSCMGFVLPAGVVNAASPANAAPTFAQDVAMQSGGKLQGKVMSTAGTAVAGAKVRVHQNDQMVAEVTTDANGAFEFSSLRGGVYHVATAGSQTQFRLWAAQTAPPHAANAALLVANTEVVRGQCGCDECCTEPSCDCGGGYVDSCTAPSCGCGGGGCGCGGCGGVGGKSWLPWVIAAGAAAAIAIPLALDDDDAS